MIRNNWISGGNVETHPNADFQTFHMRHELMGHGGRYGSASIYQSLNDKKLPFLSMTETTLKAILAIPGIVEVSCKPYQISIQKASAFTFPELYPAIKLAMSKYLPAKYK